jgi:hypothetical protein
MSFSLEQVIEKMKADKTIPPEQLERQVAWLRAEPDPEASFRMLKEMARYPIVKQVNPLIQEKPGT